VCGAQVEECKHGDTAELDVHLHGLAGVDPDDGVDGNVRFLVCHGAVDRRLLIVVYAI
jgi:hypothetical protein